MNRQDEKFTAEQIRSRYIEPETSKVDQLRKLDRKVKLPAEIFAYTFGIIGALVLGFGMCLAMKVLFDLMIVGIVVGIVGILMVCINYPVYKSILASRKRKFKDEIFAISEEILGA